METAASLCTLQPPPGQMDASDATVHNASEIRSHERLKTKSFTGNISLVFHFEHMINNCCLVAASYFFPCTCDISL